MFVAKVKKKNERRKDKRKKILYNLMCAYTEIIGLWIKGIFFLLFMFFVYFLVFLVFLLYICNCEYYEETIFRIVGAIGSLCANASIFVAPCS